MIIQEKKIIQSLLNVGINVLEVFNPICRKETLCYYAVNEFTPVQNNIYEHRIYGIDITQIIQEDSLQVNISSSIDKSNQILTKIAEMNPIVVKYSKDFSFIWYIK